MGSKCWVVNASPLILPGKTQHLDLLAALAGVVVVPQAVADEVGAKADGGVLLAELTGNAAYRIAHLRRTGLYISDALVQHILEQVGE